MDGQSRLFGKETWLAFGMAQTRVTHGWAGAIHDFLDTPPSLIEAELEKHLAGLFAQGGASPQQREAWIEEIDILRTSFRNLSISKPTSLNWSLILEFELPLEGGRRPDVIVLGPKSILVFEFKQGTKLQRSAIDQVNAYARDLAEYHSKSHSLPTIPFLIPTGTVDLDTSKDGVRILSPDKIAAVLDSFNETELVGLDEWLSGEYAPLPTLIAAAKMIFNHERLPAIKRAESLGVGKAVEVLREIAQNARTNGERALAFVSGVPGAGKTLVGLQLVYAESNTESFAVFLSGNGPLVEVLRDALQNKSFVSDLHAFIKSYGTTTKVPRQNIVVFDEAQRAWDAQYMLSKKGISESEPELLLAIGEKIADWATLVGLIGYGQEINTGEEAGIPGWNAALDSDRTTSKWKVFTPPRFGNDFPGKDVTEVPELDLSKTLRSRQAEDLHEWVNQLLLGEISQAARIADRIWLQNYPIFVTRELDLAKNYLKERYKGETESRYGILASSKDNYLPKLGLLNGYLDTRLVKNARWYNSPPGEKGSCCNLEEVVTEFACQGLELDMAMVAWGNDFLWTGDEWAMRNMRSRFPQQNPHQLRLNSYRVLLTRSRDGVVIFVPQGDQFDKTEHALLAAGARILTEYIPLQKIS